MSNEITSSIQLAARLTDALYRESIVNSDSAQALFDVLADALEKRPDIVVAVAADLAEKQQAKDDYLADVMRRLDDMEQDMLRRYHATTDVTDTLAVPCDSPERTSLMSDTEITKGHNND